MTSFVWREVMLTHLLLYGNSYSQIIRTGRNLSQVCTRFCRITWWWIVTARET